MPHTSNLPTTSNYLCTPFPFLTAEVKTVPVSTPKIEKPQVSVQQTPKKEQKIENTVAAKKSVKGGVPVADGRTLPLLLGVGPAKTSSTALFDSLGNASPQILLGNASLQGHECCGSELYYFSRRFNRSNPAAGLGAYFPIESKPNANWLAEKTPEYSDHFLAPHRVRDTLQAKALALVFTIRDPVDAHVSLYFYRMQRKNLQSSARGFLEWSTALLNANHVYRKCVQEALLARRYKEPLSTEMSPRWVGLQHLDEAVFEKCRAPFFKPSDKLEGVGSLEYSLTLPRWKRVFETSGRYFGRNNRHKLKIKNARDAEADNDDNGSRDSYIGDDDDAKRKAAVPMMCVFHENFIRNPEKETKRVAKFIGIDPKTLNFPSESSNSGKGFERSAEERVFAAEGARDKATALELWQHMKRLRGFFSGEMEFAQQFCSEIEDRESSIE
jgi:hypothetical protein